MLRTIAAIALAAAALAACDTGPEMDFGGEDLGPDRFVVHSDSGAVRMGLTDEFVYFALSDSVLAAARADMQDDADSASGLGATIGSLVRGGVERALRFRAKYPVADIRDIRWEDGRMLVEFEDGRTGFRDNIHIDDRPIEEAFARQDVEAFAAEFRKAKARAGG